MPRPLRKGLSYYPVDVDIFDDDRIFALMENFGPLGYTVYMCLLCMIYRQGYYLEIPINRLVSQIMKTIGSKWLSSRQQIIDIIEFCGRVGLFDRKLLSQEVVTSRGIQKRYDEVTARRKNQPEEYWLLDKKVSAAETPVIASETPVIAAETPVNETETPVSVYSKYTNKTIQNKTKANKSKVKETKPNQTVSPAGDSSVVLCDEVYILFDELIRPPGDADCMALDGLCEQYGAERVLAAIKIAADRGGRSAAYVRSVLENNYPARRTEPSASRSETVTASPGDHPESSSPYSLELMEDDGYSL